MSEIKESIKDLIGRTPILRAGRYPESGSRDH